MGVGVLSLGIDLNAPAFSRYLNLISQDCARGASVCKQGVSLGLHDDAENARQVRVMVGSKPPG